MYVIRRIYHLVTGGERCTQLILKMATKKASSSRIRIFESAKELDEPQEAKISGEVPSWLSGTLVRVGPGKFELGSSSYKHWFDGQALLHRFEIKNQQVTYFNKFVRSQSYTEGLKHGHVCMNEFGTVALPDPCKNIFSRYFSYYWSDGDVVTDNPVVNIVEIKGKTYATSEIPVITQIDPSTLEVIGNASYSKDFPGIFVKFIVFISMHIKFSQNSDATWLKRV